MTTNSSHPDQQLKPPRKVFTLLQLTESIRQAIQASTKGSWYWIRAEIAQIDKSGSGHHYLELIDNKNDQVRAKSRAMIWADDYARIKRELGDEVSHVLQTGTVIQCQVEISFHNVYGFSLYLKEVDLSFNLGELERKKQETIKALQKADIIDRNANLQLATIPQYIGIIGAPDTAGFADFVQQLLFNEEKYNFQIEVFPGAVQGEQAIPSLIQRLDKADKKKLDLIVLIRGGGSRMDLELFNNSEIAFKIAQLNTPIITGIGHETDSSVADLVAYHSCKTPTAAAEFILEIYRDFERDIRRDTERIRMLAIRNLKTERGFFDTIAERFSLRSASYTQLER
ncbi:MAG: exodeoxyribonuclease VII large subunit, partial [Limisphaerales bacterium]